MKKATLGLIGLGSMGQIHLRNSLKLRNAQLFAVADVSRKSLALARKLGIPSIYDNYETLLRNPEIEGVIISLPTFLHSDVATKAVESGKHVLLEKPLARNTIEGQKILSVAQKEGVKFMIGYPLRFTDSFVNLKEELDSGALGDVPIVVANNISTGPFSPRAEGSNPAPVPSWWFDKSLSGGGVLIDLGCHMINLLRWYFGEPKVVQSTFGCRFNLDFEDYAACSLKFANGTLAMLNVGWYSSYYKIQVDLYGTAKHASGGSKAYKMIDYAKNVLITDKSTGFYRELEYFADCISSDMQPSPSVYDGLGDLRVIEEIYSYLPKDFGT